MGGDSLPSLHCGGSRSTDCRDRDRCRFDLAGFAEPFSREDGSLLQGHIRIGGVVIPLFDQQPGVASQSWLSDERKLSAQFFAEQQKMEFSPFHFSSYLVLHGVVG